MKRLAGFSVLIFIFSTTAGCSSWFDWLWGDNGYFRDRANDYQEARQAPAMKLPSNMDVRPIEPLLVIPKNVADGRLSGGYEVPKPQKLQTATETRDFSLQVTQDQRWLIALRPPAHLWTAVHRFLTDNGFTIAEEKPHMGEMITAWQKSAEYTPTLRQAAASTGETRLRVRIEPGVRRNTSEIFVLTVHRSSEAGTSPMMDWPARSETPALEAAVLDEIQTTLSRTMSEGDSVSLLAERDYDAPSRVTLVKDAAGNPVLQLDTDFDRAWSRVGGAIESADIRVDDLNRSLGIYYINLSEGSSGRSAEKRGLLSSLFGSEPDPEEVEARAERYQVRVAKASDGVQVSVEKDMNTLAPADVARRILSLLQEHLEHSVKQKKPGGNLPPGNADSRGDRPPSR